MRQADRLIINVLSNYGRRGIEAATAVIVTPIVTRHLGREAFGVAMLVLSILAVFRLLSTGMGRAMQRYIPIDLERNDREQLCRTFNNSVAAFLVIGMIGGLVTWLIHDWLLGDQEMDPALRRDGEWGFLLMAGWLAIGFPSFAYRRGLEAIQRFDLDGVYTSVMTVLRMLVIVAFFWWGWDSIAMYTAIQLAGWLWVGLWARRALLKLLPGVKESWRYLDWSTTKTLTSFAAMNVVISIGQILSVHGLTFVTAKGLGMYEVGGLAAVRTVTRLLGDLINNLTTALTPTVSALDAKGSSEAVAKLLLTGSKFSLAAACLTCIVPLPAMGSVMTLWLGKEFAGLDAVLIATLLAEVPVALGSAGQQVLTGLGQLRFMGPIMFLRGLVGVVAAWVYVSYISPDLVGATACVFGARAIGGLIVHIHSSRVTDTLRIGATFETIVAPFLMAGAGAAVTWVITSQIGSDRWWKLFTSVGAGEVVFCSLLLVIGLNPEERDRLMRFARRVGRKLGFGGKAKPETPSSRP